MGSCRNRVCAQDRSQGTVIQVIGLKEQGETTNAGIDKNPQGREKRQELFPHLLDGGPKVEANGKEHKGGPEDHTALEAAARTVVAMGNDIESKELDKGG